jgi:hypothetical protein
MISGTTGTIDCNQSFFLVHRVHKSEIWENLAGICGGICGHQGHTSGVHSSLQVKCRVDTWSVKPTPLSEKPALWVTSSEHIKASFLEYIYGDQSGCSLQKCRHRGLLLVIATSNQILVQGTCIPGAIYSQSPRNFATTQIYSLAPYTLYCSLAAEKKICVAETCRAS